MHLTNEFAFFDKEYRFLYVSRFGYLNSSLPKNASARIQAAAYKELLDHLGIKKLFVFGNSAGGPSAMWFAIDYPEYTQGLILHSSAIPGPLLPPPPELIFESNFLWWEAIKSAPDMLIGTLIPKNILATITQKEKAFLIENVYMAALPITERTDGIIFDNDISTPSVNQIPIERNKVPTLILQSIDDPREKAGGEELAKRIPNSDYVRLKGGHLLLRQANKVRFEIARFILANK
jgi:pimeloyl-ACP methyl ester carboxylesterase